MQQAQPEYLEALIDVAVNPPNPHLRIDEHWRYHTCLLLEEWGVQKPDGLIQKLVPLLKDEQTRLFAFVVIVDLCDEQTLVHLEPLVDEADHLSREDREYLAEVLERTGTDFGKQLLERLKATEGTKHHEN